VLLVDIEGTLLHDDIREITGQTQYLVKQEANTDGTVYAHIIFYNSTHTQPYAEACCLLYFLLPLS
jgi:hypothetical protein